MASTRALAALALLLAGGLAAPGGAHAAQAVQELRFTASDGVVLHGTVSGEAPLRARPLIVEYSPYGQGPGGPPAGPRFNYVQIHARGTGRSGGAWDIMGAREQSDIAESLGWLCRQPWSSGRIGLYGFSASAIAAYHAMRRPRLPCVRAAALLAGTSSIYRDLIFIGGMPNLAPAAVVTGAIGSAFLSNLPGRFGDEPQSGFAAPGGVVNALSAFAAHPTQDAFWREREFPGAQGPPRIPILAATGFYDVESRGPFETFKAARPSGSHLLVIGAHDGAAGRTGGAFPAFRRWYERYLLGRRNGVEREPRVQLYVGHGGHSALRAGRWTKVSARDWPVPGTSWRALNLSAARSGAARSLNDGSLTLGRDAAATTQSAPSVPSNTFATDPYTTATVTSTQQTNLTEATSLTYTTPPLRKAVMSVGPAALRLRHSSTSPETDIVAVLSDVAPGGASLPVAAGRLRSTFTRLERSRSLTDPDTGEIVQPYNDLSAKQSVPPGQARDYQVELWPIGNRFERGHRLRLSLVGTPASFQPSVTGLNSVEVGGAAGARLQLPVLPGSDLCGALGARACPVPQPAARPTCLARRSPIGPRNIGRVRLGLTRRGLARIPVRTVRRTSTTRVFCVKRSRRRVAAVLSGPGGRARVRVVATRAAGHRMRTVGPGAAAVRLARRFPAARRIGRSLLAARPRSRRIFGVRGGRVRFVAVADRRLIGRPRALRRALRRAGL